MCGFDPFQTVSNAVNKVGVGIGKVGAGIERVRSKATGLVESAGKHGATPDPQVALDQATAQATADQLKAQQDATAAANADLLAQRRRRRLQAGLLNVDSSNGTVLSQGSGSIGSGSVLSAGANG